MKRTTNYALPTWEKSDFIKMDDFNDLTQKLDAALKSGADSAASGVSAEASARESAVAAEAQARANALAALQTALSAAIGSGGKTCRICTGSYTGTGGTSVSVTAPFYPVLAFVQSADMPSALCMFRSADTTQGNRDFGTSDSKTLSVTWGASQISWSSTSTGSMRTVYAGSSKNVEYHYVIIGFDNSAS